VNQIVSLMVHRDRQVWPVSDSQKRAAVEVVSKNMGSSSARVATRAVLNLLAMEGQNIRQEELDREALRKGGPLQPLQTQVNVQVVNINEQPQPVRQSDRLASLVALLERARERRSRGVDPATIDAVHPPGPVS